MNRLVSLQSVVVSRYDEEEDTASIMTKETRSDFTCSIVSSISLTRTVSNNVGAGRTLDNYFYKPLGRALELALNRAHAEVQSRREAKAFRTAEKQVLLACLVIRGLCTSTLSKIPGDGFSVTHWPRQPYSIGLTGLLFIWGVLNQAPGWDEGRIALQCKIIASLMSHPSPSVKAAAFKTILDLTEEFPRLCLFFDQSAVEKEAQSLQLTSEQSLKRRYSFLLDGPDDNKVKILLRRLACSIPDSVISKNNFHVFRPALLSFLANALDIYVDFKSVDLPLWTSISSLLHVKELYRYDHDNLIAQDEPIVIFWRSCYEIIVKAEKRHSVFPFYEFDVTLLNGLKNTWENAHSSQLISKSSIEKVEDLVRLSFGIIYQIFKIRPYWKRSYDAKRFVESKSVLSSDRIQKLWEESFDGNAELLRWWHELLKTHGQ
ncbi:hypothetical protein DFH11DRAFT_1543047 [Phellopilus nigrolimitatus]|nr:hypothetical protein DFH11DRAFT_1543047 [Phellopilus nigrolimitatus]